MARNNRQHKKLHSGAHTQMGFEVWFDVAEPFGTPKVEEMMDDFIFNAIECNGLTCGGGWGGNSATAHFVVDKLRPQKKCPWKFVPGSASDDDLANVETWLKAQALVSGFTISPLFDMWHDPDWEQKQDHWKDEHQAKGGVGLVRDDGAPSF